MPDDGLCAGQNMLHTCKGTFGIKINLCCVRLNKHGLLIIIIIIIKTTS